MVNTNAAEIQTVPVTSGRLTDGSAVPDDSTIRDWIGADAFKFWSEHREWIETSYPGVFAPDWRYGGKNRGWSLRYKKTKAFCTLLPEFKKFSTVIVMGRTEREKFEERRYVWRSQTVKIYDDAKTYIDGKWLTVPVYSEEDLSEVRDLLMMKRPPTNRL